MKFPATSDEMKRAGWEYSSERRCNGCDELIEFWLSPNGKAVPIGVKSKATITKASGDVREPHICT